MSTWYVRPNTSHSGTRTGVSYANAFGGWSEVIWGASGVKGGDELVVCGAHSYGAGISVGVHGGTANAPVTIRGDYAGDAGSIVFTTTTDTLTMGRSDTTLLALTLPAVTHNGAAVRCKYLNNTFNTPGNTSGIRFSASGDNHSDIEIRGNTFNTIAPSATNHAAIRWWVQTAASSTMTRLTIENNTFSNTANRSVIEMRTQTDSNAAARIQDVKINYNTFSNYRGTAIEITCPGTTGAAYHGAGCQIKGNTLTNGLESTTTNLGGGVGVWGFGLSSTPGFESNLICDNRATNLQGPTGFIDVFYGTYIIQDNIGSGFTTTTIDANGILLDIGTINTIVRRNKIDDIVGKAGVFNSGCGVMVLGKVTNTYIYGNVFTDCKNGFFLGATEGSCDVKLYNNVFVDCTDSAIITTSTAAQLNNVLCVNNLFSGVGYKVKNQTSPVITWSKENFNTFSGFLSGNQNHALGNRSRALTSTITTAFRNAVSAGVDADALNLIANLPTTLQQLT